MPPTLASHDHTTRSAWRFLLCAVFLQEPVHSLNVAYYLPEYCVTPPPFPHYAIWLSLTPSLTPQYRMGWVLKTKAKVSDGKTASNAKSFGEVVAIGRLEGTTYARNEK